MQEGSFPCKTVEPIEMPYGELTQVGPKNHVLDGVQIPQRKGRFLGFSALKLYWKALGVFAMVYAKTTEPTQMPFKGWTYVDTMKRVRWRTMSDESIRRREGWKYGDAAFCRNSLTTCFTRPFLVLKRNIIAGCETTAVRIATQSHRRYRVRTASWRWSKAVKWCCRVEFVVCRLQTFAGLRTTSPCRRTICATASFARTRSPYLSSGTLNSVRRLSSYDTIRYDRFTCAQKLARWPA